MLKTLLKLAVVFAFAAATTSVTMSARPAAGVAGPPLTSIGALSFAADGTLFAADPQAATITPST